MRRRVDEDAPEAPTGVKLVDSDGREYPCSVHYVGHDVDGIAEFAVVAPITVEHGMTVRVATLPPRTSLTFVGYAS
jgi:hypothetical protein